MFTNLIGFIRPLFKKDATTTKTISKVRQIGEDEPPGDDEFNALVDANMNKEQQKRLQPGAEDPHDIMNLSISALKHMVEISTSPKTEKDEAMEILNILETKGRTSLPLDAEKSIMEQLRQIRSEL